MKKNVVRIVAALLVAMLALTLIPMGALAANYDIFMGSHDTDRPKWTDPIFPLDPSNPFTSASGTIKATNYDTLIYIGEDLYERAGFADLSKMDNTTHVRFKSTADGKDSPTEYLIYLPHGHKLSNWYSDGTTHWRECLECKKYSKFHQPFLYQNWCQDGDEDGICNVCGGDVPYHDVTVIEEEGGKITVNRDNACHRMKITADVEPAEGYKLKKLHFTKIRDNGSEQEITRYKKNGQFWTYMPTYELEVSAEFVKVK